MIKMHRERHSRESPEERARRAGFQALRQQDAVQDEKAQH